MNREEYMAAIIPAMKLAVRKHEDYNTGVKLDDYFPFGNFSYIQMLHVKIMRLRSLVTLPEGTKPNFENLIDTVDDLINYSVYYRKHLMERENDTPL